MKILSDSYNEECPKAEKEIVVKDKAKWFNSELRVEKKKKKGTIRIQYKWKRKKCAESKSTVR